MAIIDSNSTVYQIGLDGSSNKKHNHKYLYHHSSKKSIESILRSKSIYFTNICDMEFEESKFFDRNLNPVFIACFSRKQFNAVDALKSGGKMTHGIKIELAKNQKLFPENPEYLIHAHMIDPKDKTYYFDSKLNNLCEINDLRKIWNDVKLVLEYVDVEYRQNIKRPILNVEDEEYGIINRVGKCVPKYFEFQKETRIIAYFQSSKRIEIPYSIDRLEISFSNNAKISKFSIIECSENKIK